MKTYPLYYCRGNIGDISISNELKDYFTSSELEELKEMEVIATSGSLPTYLIVELYDKKGNPIKMNDKIFVVYANTNDFMIYEEFYDYDYEDSGTDLISFFRNVENEDDIIDSRDFMRV